MDDEREGRGGCVERGVKWKERTWEERRKGWVRWRGGESNQEEQATMQAAAGSRNEGLEYMESGYST